VCPVAAFIIRLYAVIRFESVSAPLARARAATPALCDCRGYVASLSATRSFTSSTRTSTSARRSSSAMRASTASTTGSTTARGTRSAASSEVSVSVTWRLCCASVVQRVGAHSPSRVCRLVRLFLLHLCQLPLFVASSGRFCVVSAFVERWWCPCIVQGPSIRVRRLPLAPPLCTAPIVRR
jgi:hypothetical protein